MKQLLYLHVNINKYNPLRASSYVELPSQIRYKKAVINVQNNDNCCFAWAVVSAIFCNPTGPSNRTSSYPDFRNLLNFTGIEFPVKLSDIGKFEKNNPRFSINVYGLEQVFKNNSVICEIVGPLYYTDAKRPEHINLLLVTNSVGNSHYCWIKDFSRLVSLQITSRDGAKHFCDGCLHYFRTKVKLDMHQRFDCNHVYTKLPSADPIIDKLGKTVPGNILKFENYYK